MRTFLLLGVLAAAATGAGFDGRWNIKVQNEPRGRVWWLEVEGSGTPQLRGMFVGAVGGQLDKISAIRIDKGELVFEFERRYSGNKAEEPRKGTYRAKLDGDGKLQGTLSVAGSPELGRSWIGVRSPVLPDKDDGSWKKGKPVELFDGKSVAGWSAMIPNVSLGWAVKEGLLGNSIGANNLISTQKFWNFDLHMEYRLGKGSNSGVGLRGRYEVQIFDDFGQPPSQHGNGAIYSRMAPSTNASKAPGEWQTFDIRLIGRFATVVLNGTKVVDKFEIAGLTAIANDANEALPGAITIQGDHGAVEFRKITLTPLTK